MYYEYLQLTVTPSKELVINQEGGGECHILRSTQEYLPTISKKKGKFLNISWPNE